MSGLLAKTAAGLVFLFGEISTIQFARNPINAIYSSWQPFMLVPAVWAVVWVFLPLARRSPDPKIGPRLLYAGVSLILFCFLVVALMEVAYRASHSMR